MSEEHSSDIIDIKRLMRDEYIGCLVITPKHRDGHIDVSAKVERNLRMAIVCTPEELMEE